MRTPAAFFALLLPACDQVQLPDEQVDETAETQATSESPGESSGDLGATGGDVGSDSTAPATSAHTSSPDADLPTDPPGGSSDEEQTTAPAEPYVSGSRIRAVFIVGTDGSKMFRSWWDRQRKEACNWTPLSDGSYRCLPATGYAGMFADDACTRPVSTWPTGCPG